MQEEIWRPIPSLPEYIASSLGRVMRIPVVGPMPYGGERAYGGQPTVGVLKGDRYGFAYKGKNYKVHRLICEAFHGPAPFPGAVVMHLDENALNNCPENLKWGTQKENLNAPGFLQQCRARTGENNPRVKAILRREAA